LHTAHALAGAPGWVNGLLLTLRPGASQPLVRAELERALAALGLQFAGLYLPFFNDLLKTEPLTGLDLLVVFALSTLGYVTALAADRITGGYWILKSNGGADNYKAPWYGSLAGKVPAGLTVTAIAAGCAPG
jgi:hypothetical protein